MKFAKLFDLKNGEQVLAELTGYNDDDDKYILSIRTHFETAIVNMNLGFKEETVAEKALEAFTIEDAEMFRKNHEKYFPKTD